MIHVYATTLRLTMLLLFSIFAVGVIGSSAQAADADVLAHHAIRNKIKKEAGDRYDIQFLSTHVDRVAEGKRTVTGKGFFRRRGKDRQYFTYHTTVDVRNNSDKDTGYGIVPR